MRLPQFPQYPPGGEPENATERPAQTVHPDFPESPESLVALAQGDREELGNLAILFAALDIPHAFRPRSNQLLVARRDVERALSEWRLYAEENVAWPEPPVPVAEIRGVWPATLLCLAALALFHGRTGPWTEHNFWFVQGAVDRLAVIQGHEWWRLVTALTLHADSSHLLGNLAIGGCVAHLLCRRLGHGLGWLMILVAATCANWCNLAFRSGPHLSVGFSTAVFAAIGLLCGLNRPRGRWRLFQPLIPLGAGAGLLAMLGSEGARTDLGAHIFGLLCGLALGLVWRLVWRFLKTPEPGPQTQNLCFALAAALILTAWSLAMP